MRMVVLMLMCCAAGGAFIAWSVLSAPRARVEGPIVAAQGARHQTQHHAGRLASPSAPVPENDVGPVMEVRETCAPAEIAAATEAATTAPSDGQSVTGAATRKKSGAARSEVRWAAAERDGTDWAAALARQVQRVAERPEDMDARFDLAAIQMRLKLWTSALRELDDLAAARPDDVRVRVNRAQALRAAGRIGEARDEWDRVLALDAQGIAARAYRGETLLELELWTEAEADFREVLRAEPGDDVAALNLALALQKLGRTQEALIVVDRILAEKPRHLAALKRAARLAVELAAADEASRSARERALDYARRALAIDRRDDDMQAIVARWAQG